MEPQPGQAAERNDEDAVLRQQAVLAKFGEMALRCDDLDDILTEACRLIGEALDTDLAKVMALQNDGETLLVRAGVGWKPGIVGCVTVKAVEGSSEGHALKTGGPVASADIEQEDRFDYADFIKDHGVKALVNVIIIGPRDEKPFGLLQVDSRTPRDFDETDINFLRGYANLLAAAVERLRNLAQRDEAEARLRESEDHYRASVELNPQIPWTADPQGGITGFSDRWLALTGLTREAAMREGWMQAPHPDDRPRMAAAWRHAVATGEPYDVEARIGHAGGEYRWLRIKALPRRDDQGVIVGWYGTTEDVEERRRLEDALRCANQMLEQRVLERTALLEEEQRQRLEAEELLRQSQKMEAIGQLTGGVAHDFNNLLTVIRGSVDLLRRDNLTADKRTRYIDAISSTAERAAKLTGQLLAFARRQSLQPEAFDVRKRLGGVAEMLDSVTGARIRILTDVPDVPCVVRADISQFETALINMAVNARDAMDGEGTLTIAVKFGQVMPVIRGHAGGPGPFVTVALTDTGAGIPMEDQSHIFEPFFTTKEVGKGTGLGLSQVFGFAKQSGGDVDVESEPGRTTFTLFLPEAGTDQLSVEKAGGNAIDAEGKGLCVLIVEDNVEVGRFCTQLLEEFGYRTVWVTSAEEALARLGDDGAGIDIVFSDVVMPGMGGIELAKVLHRRFPELPVILASGYSHVLAREGADGLELLQKPYSADELTGTISTVARRGRRGGTRAVDAAAALGR
ncbi:PAS domain-containing protein [Sphingomonas sp.]|uniref:PAS domain-containing protein n=1 Tax=Sphingomonas sp. TaxID=28214 RepID=UPI003B002753